MEGIGASTLPRLPLTITLSVTYLEKFPINKNIIFCVFGVFSIFNDKSICASKHACNLFVTNRNLEQPELCRTFALCVCFALGMMSNNQRCKFSSFQGSELLSVTVVFKAKAVVMNLFSEVILNRFIFDTVEPCRSFFYCVEHLHDVFCETALSNVCGYLRNM